MLHFSSSVLPAKTSYSLDMSVPQEHIRSPDMSYIDTLCMGPPNVVSFESKVGRGRSAPSLAVTCWVLLNGIGAEDQPPSLKVSHCGEFRCMPTVPDFGVGNESKRNLFFLGLICWVTSFVQF